MTVAASRLFSRENLDLRTPRNIRSALEISSARRGQTNLPSETQVSDLEKCGKYKPSSCVSGKSTAPICVWTGQDSDVAIGSNG